MPDHLDSGSPLRIRLDPDDVRRARLLICTYAHDVADARVLLEALGLLDEPEVVEPPPVRVVVVPAAIPAPGVAGHRLCRMPGCKLHTSKAYQRGPTS